MSAPPGEVVDLLDRLAHGAPQGLVDPDVVWARGRRRQWGSRLAVAAAAIVVAGMVGIGAAPVVRLVDAPVAGVAPGSGTVLPDVVRQPGGWEPAFGSAPGPLSAVGAGARSGWLSSAPALWGVSALTGESRFLDLPDLAEGDGFALSADGTRLAYWSSTGSPGPADDGGSGLPVAGGITVLDLTSGAEVRWDPGSRFGVWTGGLAWAGGTLWFESGDLLDSDRNSARTATYAWTPGQPPRALADGVLGRADMNGSVGTDADGFVVGSGSTVKWVRRVTASGDVTRIDLVLDGAVSSPVLAPGGLRVAAIRQRSLNYSDASDHALLVGDVDGGQVALGPVAGVEAQQVLGWRSDRQVAVSSWDQEGQLAHVSAVDVTSGRSEHLVDVAGALPRFAADAWSGDVVAAPRAPFAPDPRLAAAFSAVLLAFGVSVWRSVRGRRGHP